MTKVPKKIVVIMGTRPEAIKLAPVYLELQRRSSTFQPLLWVTGQHRQMLDQVLDTFQLTPHRDFNVMKQGQSLTYVTTAVLSALEPAFLEEKPDCVVVQGDTTTAFAGALAAYYQQIPVGHVEAGLRTDTKYAPFPEEMNRRLASRLTDFHFAPTVWAQRNLRKESIPEAAIIVTGNTVIDALDIIVNEVRTHPPHLPEDFPLEALNQGHPMVLITGHRRENFGEGFESLCQAIAHLASQIGRAHV